MRKAHQYLALASFVSALLVLQLRASPLSRSRYADDGTDAVQGVAAYSLLVHAAFACSSVCLVALLLYDRATGAALGVLPHRGAPPGSRWNGSRWVRDPRPARAPSASGTPLAEPPAAAASYAYASPAGAGVTVDAYAASYQTEETPEEARRRAERERAEAEYWARVEAEDDAREERAGEEEEEREKEARDRRRDARKDAKRKSKAAERCGGGGGGGGAFVVRGACLIRLRDVALARPEVLLLLLGSREEMGSIRRAMGGVGGVREPTRAPLLGYDDIPWPPKMSSLLAHAVAGRSGRMTPRGRTCARPPSDLERRNSRTIGACEGGTRISSRRDGARGFVRKIARACSSESTPSRGRSTSRSPRAVSGRRRGRRNDGRAAARADARKTPRPGAVHGDVARVACGRVATRDTIERAPRTSRRSGSGRTAS